jgi:alanine dehydrogenase
LALILTRADVEAVLNMREAIDVLERAFRELADGKAAVPTRLGLRIEEANGVFLAMPAHLTASGALGMKLVTSYPDNPGRHRLPTIQATILYYDHQTGRPLALMEGAHITAVRTGAASGLATRYLARETSRVVGLIGSGVQAETQLEAVSCVRPLSEAKVYSPTPSRAASFAARMSAMLDIDVRPVDEARHAVEGCDIVIAATSSKDPVVKGEWIDAGTHINGVGSHAADARELDSDAVRRAKVVVDSLAAALEEAGDLLLPMAEGVITKEHIHAELGEVVAGSKPGRTGQQEVTFFKSVGLAIEDVAVAQLVYERARNLGIGRDFDL